MSLFQNLIQRGTRGAQPAANTVPVGTLYYVTDEGVTERSNGATWDTYTDGGTNQTANIKVSAGTLSSRRSDFTFADSNGISFGLNTNGVITATGGGGGGGTVTFSAGTSSAGLNSLVFADSNNVSFGLNGSTLTASINTSLSNVRVSAGTTSNLLSAMTFANSNNVSFGINASTITASINTSLSNVRVSAGTTSNLLSALTFADSNGISFGINASTITATVKTDYLTTAMASNRGSDFVQATAAFHGTNASGTIASNDVSVSVAAQSNQSAIKGLGATNTGNTAGNTGLSTGIDWVIAGSNNITISESTAGGGPNTLWISGPTVGGAQTAISGVGVSDTTYTSGTVILSAQANITIGSSVNGASQYAKFSVAAQTADSAGFYAVGNTTQNSSTTLDIRTLSLNGLGGISVGYSNGSIDISGPQTVAQTNQTVGLYAVGNTTQNSSTTLDARTLSFNGLGVLSVGFSNGSIDLSVSAAQTNQTIGFYAVGNTTQNSSTTLDARTVSLNGISGITVGYSNGSIDLSVSTYNTIGTATTVYNIATAASVGTVSRWAAEDHRHAQDFASFCEPNPYEVLNNSATTTFGIGTMYLMPFTLRQPISFDRVAIIGSASLPATSVANTVSVSFGTSGQSQAFAATFNNQISQQLNLFIFSQAGGGSSSDLATVSSTSNTIVSYISNTISHSATCGANSITQTLSSSISYVVSYPGVTSGTTTSVNAATTITTWGVGYSSWTSSTSTSTSSAGTSNATKSISCPSAFPATTAWASNKMIFMPFAVSLSSGVYWLGFNFSTNSGTSSTSANTSVAAGRSYTTAFSASNCGSSVQPVTTVGATTTLASSLAYFGAGAANSLGPNFGAGTFSATYAATKTFYNNAGQANGEIALSDINTNVSFWRPWFQMASNRY